MDYLLLYLAAFTVRAHSLVVGAVLLTVSLYVDCSYVDGDSFVVFIIDTTNRVPPSSVVRKDEVLFVLNFYLPFLPSLIEAVLLLLVQGCRDRRSGCSCHTVVTKNSQSRLDGGNVQLLKSSVYCLCLLCCCSPRQCTPELVISSDEAKCDYESSCNKELCVTGNKRQYDARNQQNGNEQKRRLGE